MARRRRYRKNPSTTTKVLMVGGGALAAFFVYSKFFAKEAAAATVVNPITGAVDPGPLPETKGVVGVVTDAAASITSGISNLFSGVTTAAGVMSDFEKFKAYQKQLNALGARLVVNGIVGQKTLDANNKYMPMKYTSIPLLKSAILGGVAGVAGLSNYYLEA